MTCIKELAESVQGWGNCTDAWLDTSEDNAVAVVGYIDEDGNAYPVAVVDCEQYYAEHDSMKLARFYAAANPTAVLELLAESDQLRQQLTEREKKAALLRDALNDLASCMQGVIEGDYTPDSFTLQPANTALAATDDLSGYILCEKEPVVWMQSDHLSRFVHHACGSQAALVRCSDHQLMPDFQPLYRAKEPKP